MLFVENLPIKIHNNEVLLRVKVTPKASTNRIGKILNDHLKIYVTAAPENGQANKAVIDLLANELKMPKNNLSIMQGLTGQVKIVSFVGYKDIIIKRLQILISG